MSYRYTIQEEQKQQGGRKLTSQAEKRRPFDSKNRSIGRIDRERQHYAGLSTNTAASDDDNHRKTRDIWFAQQHRPTETIETKAQPSLSETWIGMTRKTDPRHQQGLREQNEPCYRVPKIAEIHFPTPDKRHAQQTSSESHL